MITLEDAARIAQQAMPKTPLERLAGDALGQRPAMKARMEALVEFLAGKGAAEQVATLRQAAKDWNQWVALAAGSGWQADKACAAMSREGSDAMMIAIAADAVSMCADAIERASARTAEAA